MSREPIGSGGSKSEGTLEAVQRRLLQHLERLQGQLLPGRSGGRQSVVGPEGHHQGCDLVEVDRNNPECPHADPPSAADCIRLPRRRWRFQPRAGRRRSSKPVRIIVGFPAGGGTDMIARILAERLRGSYASAVLVENKPGASARLAAEFVKNAEPDGSVLLFTPDFTMTIYPHSFRALSYDPVRDFTPIAPVARSMLTYNVGPAVPESVKTLADFVAWCKANPAKATLCDHLGRRHAALRRHDAGQRSARADDGGALPRRRTGAAGPARRPCAGEHQSDQRDAAVRARRKPARAGGDRLEALDVPARRADHAGSRLRRRLRLVARRARARQDAGRDRQAR